MIHLRGGEASDVGKVRSVNQDRAVVFDNHLFAVADGMGGHRAGEVAAEIAINALGENFGPGLADPTTDALIAAVEAANARILDQADNDEELHGMGTTLTAVGLVQDGEQPLLAIVNVGDSRTYWMRNGELEQLTQDHSMVAEMVRAGQLTEDEARNHRQRSVLTRALGVEHGVKVDVLEVIPVEGQRYLLCSDGLTGEVHDDAIAAVLRRIADPKEAAAELVRLAVTKGGRDNVTVVVLDVVDDDEITMLASRGIDDAPLVEVLTADSAATVPIPETAAAAFAASIAAAAHLDDTPPSAIDTPATTIDPVVADEPVADEPSADPADDPTTVLEAVPPLGPNDAEEVVEPEIGRKNRSTRRSDAPKDPKELRSRMITWRVVVFLAALAAIAALAIWAVRRADDVAPKPTTTSVVLTVDTTTPAVGSGTTPPDTTPVAITVATTILSVVNGESPATASTTVAVASTADPFGPISNGPGPSTNQKGP